MGTVTYIPGGDVTLDDADILINTVNCVGVMGAGVAKAFATRFPWIVEPYRKACREGVITPGSCHLYDLEDGSGRRWAAFATKDHWMYPSKRRWVEQGLRELAREAGRAGRRSIALPPPGCGHGKLDWRDVEPLVLEELAGFDLRIYAPNTVKALA